MFDIATPPQWRRKYIHCNTKKTTRVRQRFTLLIAIAAMNNTPSELVHRPVSQTHGQLDGVAAHQFIYPQCFQSEGASESSVDGRAGSWRANRGCSCEARRGAAAAEH